MLRHQKLFRQLCVRGARYSGLPQLAAGRPHAPHERRAAAGRITATMSGCTVRVRSLQRPWVVFSVGGAQQTARATAARYCGSRRATTARHYDTLPRQAAHGTRLSEGGSRRMAALRVSFFCVSRAAVLTCFDGDVNSLVSLQGHWKQGVGGQNAPSPNLWQIR